MKSIIKFSFAGILLLPVLMILGFKTETKSEQTPQNVKFTILYDNYGNKENIKTAWGFSCLIETGGKTILFDTGGSKDILKNNIEQLHIDLSTIDMIVISHEHWDHIGGLKYILSQNSNLSVYVPSCSSDKLISGIEETGAIAIKAENPVKIADNIWLTGTMMNIEQSLIVDSPKGSIIVTGCSHQGIVNILKKTIEINNKEIFLVFGGFHLLQHSEKAVEGIITEFNKLKVNKCGASHCTGGPQIQQFKDSFGENYFELAAGKIFNITDKGITQL